MFLRIELFIEIYYLVDQKDEIDSYFNMEFVTEYLRDFKNIAAT